MPRTIDQYEKKGDDASDLEALSEKLTSDLHKHMHLIVSQPVLNDAWVKMADLVGRIATISEMEAKLPSQNPNATLWESEEMALRFVMEDGKLNLCLRNLVEFREFQLSCASSSPASARRSVDQESKSESKLVLEAADSESAAWRQDKMDKFEKGMGLMLRNAWQHVEAVQTTDLPVLIHYIASVLGEAADADAGSGGRARVARLSAANDLHERQEVMVLHYLRGLCTRADDLNGLRFMEVVREARVAEQLVAFLHLHHSLLRAADLLVAAQALSELVDSEDFQTFEDKHLSKQGAEKVATFRETFLDQFTDDYDKRKTIQPLLRFIQDCQYK